MSPSKDKNLDRPLHVLYSFPHRLGGGRINSTAWEMINGASDAGVDMLVCPASVNTPLPPPIRVNSTLAPGNLRVPFRALGKMRTLRLHDYIVSRRLERLAGWVDVVHTWPVGALRTLKTAAKLGIPSVLERPNAHTRYAYESVRREAERIGVELPADDEYAFHKDVLEREEEEYLATDFLLCPSDFTIKTFIEKGIPAQKLLKHGYGFDEKAFYPDTSRKLASGEGLTMLFAGVAAVRKGLHFALEAWFKSSAHEKGTFLIAGQVLPAYAERFSGMLAHPSVRVLGQRSDLPDLMRQSDLLVLPSIEEGFGLVCVEAIGCGCVPLVSEACTDVCKHMVNALVHRIGDASELARQIEMLEQNRDLLARLRNECIRTAANYTWKAAGRCLHDVYREALVRKQSGSPNSGTLAQ